MTKLGRNITNTASHDFAAKFGPISSNTFGDIHIINEAIGVNDASKLKVEIVSSQRQISLKKMLRLFLIKREIK